MKKLIFILFVVPTLLFSQLNVEKSNTSNDTLTIRSRTKIGDWGEAIKFEQTIHGNLLVNEDDKFKAGLPAKLKIGNEYFYRLIVDVTRDGMGNMYIRFNERGFDKVAEFYLGSQEKLLIVELETKDELARSISNNFNKGLKFNEATYLVNISGSKEFYCIPFVDSTIIQDHISIQFFKQDENEKLEVVTGDDWGGQDYFTNSYKLNPNEKLNVRINHLRANDKRQIKSSKIYLWFILE